MPAFAIGHITVLDPVAWDDYRSKVPDTLAPFGGEVLCRARTARVVAGTHRHEQTVVIRFADLERASAWFDSPAYQALLPLRSRAAEVDLALLDAL